MRTYMLDTNICIYTIKHRPPAVRQAFNRCSGRMCISTITEMELLFGAEKSSAPARNLSVVEGFVKRLDVLDYDRPAAAGTAQLRAELAAVGTPIGPYDSAIAGHARSHGLILVTHNTKEFARVPGLRIEDWTSTTHGATPSL